MNYITIPQNRKKIKTVISLKSMVYKIRVVKVENSYLDILNKIKQIVSIKECNLVTQEYGLVLSDNQIMNLLEKRKEALKNTRYILRI